MNEEIKSLIQYRIARSRETLDDAGPYRSDKLSRF